ncbi:MAG: hypothetical protein GX607_00565, partial [Myxococcales bacterium]|nr:hypothetical protein [Myxococcales bacterium]
YDARDAGIDLVARTQGTGESHAIQGKLYAEDYRLQKSDIDSFFTASGRKHFPLRIIVSTTNNWTEHAEAALVDQNPLSAFLGDAVSPPSCLLEGRGHDPRIEDIVHPVALSFQGARINLPPENPPLPKRIRPFKRTRTGPFCSSANLDQLRSLRARFIDEPPEVHSIEPPYAFLFYNAVTGAIYYWAWITGEE